MGWYAKPRGGYEYNSWEWVQNVAEMNRFFRERGYTYQAIAGILGNVHHESGMNPWRWQSDEVNYNGGYGLFQYTPASGYLALSKLPNYSPNLSVAEVTANATPSDGLAQCVVFDEDKLAKWMTGCWRTYWDSNVYADLKNVSQEILNKYGNGKSITLSQFMGIDDVYYATFAFLACFEGPLVPNMTPRYKTAQDVYTIITGDIPVPEPVVKKKKMPLWFMMRFGL